MTLQEMIKAGGVLMYVLAALSIIGLAIIVFLFVVVNARRAVPSLLLKDIVYKIKEGDYDEARHICEYKRSAISTIALSALQYLKDSEGKNPALLKDIIESEGRRQADRILGPTQYLLDIAAVAPMVGLLGTVFGMIKAFSVIAYDIAKAKPILLAHGVAMALITTAFGLIVGIPAMVAYAYFRRKGIKVVSRLEFASTEILTAFQRGFR